MKPVGLVERAIRNSSRAGQIVLDAFGGAGSTLIACETTGRRAQLIELDPKYVDVTVKRWQDYTGQSKEQSQGAGWETAIHPEDLPGLLSKWEKSRDCVADRCEARLRRFDGVFRWFSLRREPLLDESGSVTRWFGTGIDIEPIKQRETLRAAEQRTLELIADGASLKDVLNQLCSSIDVQVAPSVTTVLLRDPDRECLWHGGGLGVPHEWISAIIPVPIDEVGLCGRAAFLKERVVVPDVATDPSWPDEYRDLAISERFLQHFWKSQNPKPA